MKPSKHIYMLKVCSMRERLYIKNKKKYLQILCNKNNIRIIKCSREKKNIPTIDGKSFTKKLMWLKKFCMDEKFFQKICWV